MLENPSPVLDAAAGASGTALERAFDHAPLGMVLQGVDGRIRRANDACVRMLGYAPGALAGMAVAALLDPDDAAADARSRNSLLEGAADVSHCELRWRHRQGRTVWTRVTRTLTRDEQGAPDCFVDQWQDLTERRRADKEIVLLNNLLEQRILRRTRELEGSHEDLREFAHAVAHDVRGPLGAIDGFSARLQRSLAGRLQSEERRYLERVRAGVRSIAELTDGLLTLVDISRTPLEVETVDLGALAADILQRLQTAAPERQVEVFITADQPARGDARLLATVLEQLLHNAWKFTDAEGGARITFGAEPHGTATCYFVRDNGFGFDAAHADKLFLPFQRLHDPSEGAGIGLGLALVRKIVARHGGRVWAEGEPGQGACFYFTLPDPTRPADA